MRCRRYRFTTRDGSKSVAGSLAFFATSAISIAAILLVAGAPAASLGSASAAIVGGGADPIIVALGASALLTLVEAAAWAGVDNFTIPFAGGILMRSFEGSLPGGMQ